MSDRQVPVFPLPLVLYPGLSVPLHVFEPRYRQLLEDVGGVDGRFAIVLVEPDADDAEAARLHTVGCMARITEIEPLPDGRANIVVVGEERVRLLDWQEERPYATGAVQILDEDTGSASLAGLVRQRFAEYVDVLFGLVHMRPPEIPDTAEACDLSYQVAGAMHLEAAEKQFLLRCPSTDERLSTLLQLLSRETQRVSAFVDIAHQQGKQFFGGVPFSVN
jgi:Lon protease-like protein